MRALKLELLDHLVGLGEQGRRHIEAERLRAGQIDDEIELGWLLYRQVGGLRPAQNLVILVGAQFTLLLKIQNRQKCLDLPLHGGLIERLALEASVRGQSVVDLIGTILSQVVRKDLVGKLLRNGNSS
jgi:hypothetical protein